MVAGLCGPAGDKDARGAFAPELEAERTGTDASTYAAGYEADCDDDAARVGRNFEFEWGTYHDEWKDTPIHVAVTSMFAEYAVIYARIAGRTTSAVPLPMTMTEGMDVAERAKDCVNKFVTPILGYIASFKVHKLLCHVAEAVKWHGNIQTCNTAANESEHKSEKPYYCRTSKNRRTFTRQLVYHAHGAREILRRHAAADKDAAVAWEAEMTRRTASVPAAELDPAAAAAAGEATESGAAASGVAASGGAAVSGTAASRAAASRKPASGTLARGAAVSEATASVTAARGAASSGVEASGATASGAAVSEAARSAGVLLLGWGGADAAAR